MQPILGEGLPGLAGKRVLVTAGARGIGRAMAAAFHGAGARVHVCDLDAGALEEAAAALPGLGATACDVSEETAVDALFEAVEASLGGLDVLVNNAGIAGPAGPVESLELAGWRATLAVNLDAAFLCCRRAVPLLKAAGGGAIVNLSSTAGLWGYPLRTPYASAKWAVIGLTKSLASELGGHGIRVNALCPGSVEGERMDRVIANEARARGIPEEKVRASYVQGVAMKTFVRAEEIAAMALYLCSDAGRHVSGQAIAIDGHTESLVVPDS